MDLLGFFFFSFFSSSWSNCLHFSFWSHFRSRVGVMQGSAFGKRETRHWEWKILCDYRKQIDYQEQWDDWYQTGINCPIGYIDIESCTGIKEFETNLTLSAKSNGNDDNLIKNIHAAEWLYQWCLVFLYPRNGCISGILYYSSYPNDHYFADRRENRMQK